MEQEQLARARRSKAGPLLAVLLLTAVVAGALSDPPLTTADIVRYLRAGISERTVLTELQGRGFWATLDKTSEMFLRSAGASDALVAAIRDAAPRPPSTPTPAPPTASVPPGEDRSMVPISGQGPTFAATARTVRLPVSALDRYGEPVLGLSAENFKVAENGKWQRITLFSSERQPMRIALALDVSGSMEDKIGQVEEALKHFISLLEPKDEIMVLTFNRQVHILQDFTSDRDRLESVLTMLQPTGPTALYDAAYEAIRRVAKAPAESKAVVLVTDGVNTASGTTFENLKELARRSEVPVFSLALDSGSPMHNVLRPAPPNGGGRGRPGGGGGGGGRGGGGGGFPMGGFGGRAPWGGGRSGFDVKPLQELADETGGRTEIIDGLEHYTPGEDLPGGGRLKKAVENIALTLRHRYLVGYEPPDGVPGWRPILVQVDHPANIATRSRKGYFAGK